MKERERWMGWKLKDGLSAGSKGEQNKLTGEVVYRYRAGQVNSSRILFPIGLESE